MRSIAKVVLGALVVLTTWIAHGADFKNGSEMIRVPAGVFVMGSNNGPEDELCALIPTDYGS